MENRRVVAVPVRDEGPVQAKGRDFEPLETHPPDADNRPKGSGAFDCKSPRHDHPEEQDGKKD
ncbi:MAG TPA: hypothetical protein VJ725_27390 [Thermoanaerobaculia bacterium]|nr:hypothetical protein [Thermoanaerobaculia bacterium]